MISEGGVKEYDFLSLSQLPASVALDGGNVHFSSILAKVETCSVLHSDLVFILEPRATSPIASFPGFPETSLCV